ncbi:MAG: hypothetical protein FJY73_08110 [Candidatus Eisenbacteria bacterium]|nr:hypothetical protein [Candidatus Eisenbacteria bacterium]
MKSEESSQAPGEIDSEGAFSPERVDLTLIRWMLRLTPAERLRVLQKNVRSIVRLRARARRA